MTGSDEQSSDTNQKTPDFRGAAKPSSGTTRSPQTHHKRDRQAHHLHFRVWTVLPSIHKSDTVLVRIQAQNIGAICRWAKKCGARTEPFGTLDGFCSLNPDASREGQR